MPKQDISFKKTVRDIKLYNEIISKDEKSEFVKDAIEFYIKYSKYEIEIAMFIKNLDKK